jgi:hypothetical protein
LTRVFFDGSSARATRHHLSPGGGGSIGAVHETFVGRGSIAGAIGAFGSG